ncbi:c-type cytochrome [Aquabacterium sp.]|uniref:c-type cytochrome n=1 Tax=Aquabacterium sp. TaxID=1872578 RepID=UPI003D6D90D4
MKTLSPLICSLGLAVASLLTQAAHAQETKPGDPVAAQKKVAMCIGCHGIVGYQASFPEVHRVPMISGQSAKYIAAALHAYQKGERKHPTMRGIAASLTDQDIADISVYYEANGKNLPAHTGKGRAPSAEVDALLKKGNCASCHGADLNKPIDVYPKLAGQYEDYVFVAMKSYQTEGKGPIGRGNPIMAAQAKMFTLPELKLLANYIGSLPSDLKTVPQSKFR